MAVQETAQVVKLVHNTDRSERWAHAEQLVADAHCGIEVSTPDMDVHKDNAAQCKGPSSPRLPKCHRLLGLRQRLIMLLQVTQDQRGFTRKGSGVKGTQPGMSSIRRSIERVMGRFESAHRWRALCPCGQSSGLHRLEPCSERGNSRTTAGEVEPGLSPAGGTRCVTRLKGEVAIARGDVRGKR
ncbi:hypothetical protein [Streptomyces sp. NBC_00842]|uniref:hypothetical protein n=1 Tax=Streptomyces sp. NBC_00842 TaxID=2975848 RepID=UPI00386BA5C0|nr:hypothetical protein OH821_33265 [Streptomyces sp. NBC_00842]